MNEFERIAWIQKELVTPDFAAQEGGLVVGNGDDAAVLGALAAPTISVDAQVEGTHFRRSFASWELIGRRAVMSAMSDLGAMGAAPVAAFVSLELPSDFPDADFQALMRGAQHACDACGAVIAGGNLSGGSKVAMHTTVLGDAANPPITRSGGNPGDALWCAGFPGAAALGLEVLLRRDAGEVGLDSDRYETFASAWRKPTANVRLTEARGVTAAIDVSDGLVADLGHLAKSSGVEVHIELASIPRLDGFSDACAALGVRERDLLLHGGEVYDLVFAAEPEAHFAWATRIGQLREGAPRVFVDGAVETKRGFDHFRPQG